MRSPGLRGISEGATTVQSCPQGLQLTVDTVAARTRFVAEPQLRLRGGQLAHQLGQRFTHRRYRAIKLRSFPIPTGKRNGDRIFVYVQADGIYFNVRLDKDRPCVLVLVGATAEGCKEVIAIEDGQRESKLSWQTLLRDLKARGLTIDPFLAVGDGALGFWAALEEEYPRTKHQRCWVHKTANVLDKLPKSVQPDAKRLIHEMYRSPSRKHALTTYDRFCELYQARYPKACECLTKDRDVLFTYYNFPAIHWLHLRSTNPIESTFATVRHRTRQTKGCGSVNATMAMVYKLALGAEKSWLRLRGSNLIQLVVDGALFEDGDLKESEKERSTKAGAHTPATRPGGICTTVRMESLNEGRGAYPGDTRSLSSRQHSAAKTLNEGRGAYPGDTLVPE